MTGFGHLPERLRLAFSGVLLNATSRVCAVDSKGFTYYAGVDAPAQNPFETSGFIFGTSFRDIPKPRWREPAVPTTTYSPNSSIGVIKLSSTIL